MATHIDKMNLNNILNILLKKDNGQIKGSIRLTGDEFKETANDFEQTMKEKKQEEYEKRLKKGEDARKPGGGRKGKMKTLFEMLFYALSYIKCYPTFDVLGALFGVDRSIARRRIQQLVFLICNMSNIFKRRISPPYFSVYKKYQNLLKDKIGLEIGGPSNIFSKYGCIPIYPVVKRLDGCNFGEKTIWEGEIKEGNNYRYGNKVGYQYILDGTDLKDIPSETYDFILSSHCLEHIANPLKAIKEWLRVLKSDGILLIVVPNKDYTFDHRRPITSFEHLLNDFRNNIKEDDLTHLEEILILHDLKLDPLAGDKKSFKNRSLKNYENRCLHHHVFDIQLLIKIFDYFNIEVVTTDYAKPFHIIITGKKKYKEIK